MRHAQDGKTPLHMATETDVAAVVSALLDAGVDVNAKDKVRCSIRIARVLSRLVLRIKGFASPSCRHLLTTTRAGAAAECRHAAAQCRVEGPPVCRDAAAGPGG